MESSQENNDKISLSSMREILNFIVTEKVTVAELIKLLPELANLQKAQAPNIKASLDSLRANHESEFNAVNSLFQQEVDEIKERIKESSNKEEKRYWTEELRRTLRENLNEIKDMSDKNRKMWLLILTAFILSPLAIFAIVKRNG